MKIYHYTTIPTLALILHSKKMRFNRLDRVDDIEESAYGSGPLNIKLSKYHFVSCWTKSGNENLALWNMYTRYKGVRIGLESVPFETYKVTDTFSSLIPESMMFGKDYFASSFNNPATLYDIEYVDNPKERIKLLVETKDDRTSFDTPHIGIYKRKEWEIQQESRFKINVFPFDFRYVIEEVKKNHSHCEVDKLISKENIGSIMFGMIKSTVPSMALNKPVSLEYIDRPLDLDKLNHIEVMLGPLTTEADRIIVDSLLKSFPNHVLIDSTFKGKIRDKR